MENRVPARLSASEGRSFALTVGAAFAGFALVFAWRDRATLATVAGAAAVALGMAGLAVPAHLGPVRAAWMRLAFAISKVTTPVFMGAVYYLVITPIAVLRRRLGHNSLVRTDGPQTGFWVLRDPTQRGDLRRQF